MAPNAPFEPPTTIQNLHEALCYYENVEINFSSYKLNNIKNNNINRNSSSNPSFMIGTRYIEC